MKNEPSDWRSWWQVLSTVLLVVGTFFTMFLVMENYGFVYALLMTPFSGILLTRTFILYHDCIHNNLFTSWKVNYYVAEFLSFVGFHPHLSWGGNHLYHHAHFGKLSAAGRGDIPFATTFKYKKADKNKKRFFRFLRSPYMPWLFAFLYHVQMREPLWNSKAEFLGTSTHESSRIIKNLRRAVLYNFVLAAGLFFASPLLLVLYLSSVYLCWVVGFYLFFIQHAHEGAVFEKGRDWNHEDSAIRGSSYIKVGKIAEYFICSINYHHVHHYDSSVPNYLLKEFHEEHFKDDPRVHTLESFADIVKCFDTKLWDTKDKKWVNTYE